MSQKNQKNSQNQKNQKHRQNRSLKENQLKPLADALLPYSYTVKSYDKKTLVLQAGNGTEVTFETVGTSPVVASLSSGDEWAVRQVADLLQNHPAFEFKKEEHEGTPWSIQFKESQLKHHQNVTSALLNEMPAAPAAPPKEAPVKPQPKTEPKPEKAPSEPAPDFDPFRPNQPAVMPDPKAKAEAKKKKTDS